jgi:hypothetical protein
MIFDDVWEKVKKGGLNHEGTKGTKNDENQRF